ncbi:hypothetical protein [Rufibacter latericius]|uniref:Lipocalin-like domain-containing protein n=1 Tax=Rufibacter latericius TaxID=2487040 RepID=A0A3M9MG73_9BACT|nr:hypothetical protein [Rufibacter latericius]RNI23638.1 hypothetical protein EFB08_19115 [Rufibacter latericius]
MFNKSYLLTILAAFTFVFSSCDKDKDKEENDPKPNVEAQLAKEEWKVTSHIVEAAGQEDYDVMEEDYGGDIFVQFDGEGEYSMSTERNGDSEFDGAYDVDNNNITWDFPLSLMAQLSQEEEASYSIDQLTGSTLKITSTKTFQGVKVTEKITFSAQ